MKMFAKTFLKWTPACVSLQNEPYPDPCYALCMILLISPSVGGVGFAEYVCAHPCFTNYFTEEGPDYIPEDVE
jgi:hypothetical protein